MKMIEQKTGIKVSCCCNDYRGYTHCYSWSLSGEPLFCCFGSKIVAWKTIENGIVIHEGDIRKEK